MAQSKTNVLPVVSREDVRELQGVVTLPGILSAYGIGAEERAPRAGAMHEPRASRFFVPGVIAAALVLLIFIGGLNYYYRTERSTRAEQSYKAGTDLSQQNRDAEAIEQFRNALSIFPGNERYRQALGLELVKMGRPDEGSVYLNEVLKQDATNGPANLGLARISAAHQSTSDAVTHYHRAIDGAWPADQERNRIEARFELADYLARQGLKTQAIAELLSGLGQARDNATRKRIGRLLMEYGSPRQSAEVFRGIAQDDNRDAEAYAGLGAAELAQDDIQAARTTFRQALRLDSANVAAPSQLELIERVLALDPEARGITASERNRRSRQLLEGALKFAGPCISDPQLAQTASKALAEKPNRRTLGDATEQNLTLAVELWRARSPACPAPQGSDEALARELARLARH
jgi:tetratricopeptide (TPR) repeat protein